MSCRSLIVCLCQITLCLVLLSAGTASADTPNRDPSFAAPQGYAKITSFLGTSTYLSSTPQRLLITSSGTHYLVGTGVTAVGVQPVQKVISITCLDANGQLNTGFFGTGQRSFKLTSSGMLRDVTVADAAIVPGVGIAIAGNFVDGNVFGFVVLINFAGNPVTSFGNGGVVGFINQEPIAIAADAGGIFVAGSSPFADQFTSIDLWVNAYSLTGGARPNWNNEFSFRWGHVDSQNRRDYRDYPLGMAVDANGRLAVVGYTGRSSESVAYGTALVLGPTGLLEHARVDSPLDCAANAGRRWLYYTAVVSTGARAYIAQQQSIDNAACPDVPASSFGARELDLATSALATVGSTSTRASCCGGDGAFVSLGDIARDDRGRVYLAFTTGLTSPGWRGHLVRFDPALGGAPDPGFGDGGFGTYNLDSPSLDAGLSAIAFDPQRRLVAAGYITSDILGNPQNFDMWAFRIRDEQLFGNGFE